MTELSVLTSNILSSENTKPIHYHLDFERYTQHLVSVQMSFIADTDQPIVWLPSWLPGSYLMREFARNITAVQYSTQLPDLDNEDSTEDEAFYDLDSSDVDNSDIDSSEFEGSQAGSESSDSLASTTESETLHRAQKISKNEWQLTQVSAGDEVVVSYEVYCFDLSVRTAYVDSERLFGNFTSLALTVEGQGHQPVQVTLSVPTSFYQGKVVDDSANVDSADIDNADIDNAAQVKLACGLPHIHLQSDDNHYYSMQAASYDDLIDYPFEISTQAEGSFIVHDDEHNALVHRIFISGRHQTDMARLQQDLATICQTYVTWLGDTPFANYTFMTYASGNDYGGLEHINSTSLITPRRELPTSLEPDEPQSAYQRYLGLCSHEYFHAWWVKTVRPDVMIDVNLREEAYTPLLWVFEGFTSYIDEFILQASGVISEKSYLLLLTEQINRYLQTHGRKLQTVAESSFDAWIKLYRSDENTGNAGISYYNKGALVALCLDLLLLKHSGGQYRLFDIVKGFYQAAKASGNRQIGMTTASLGEMIGGFVDQEIWSDFAARYIDGVEELPIIELLEDNGIAVGEVSTDNSLPWGITVSESPTGLQVNKVLRGSVAAAAGLSAKDTIVAIDHLKADKAQLKYAAESGQDNITCHVFRRDELLTVTIPAQITVADETGTEQTISANPSLGKVRLTLKDAGWQDWLKVLAKTDK